VGPVPYIVVGYVQVTIILFAAKILFGVPMVGSLALRSLALIALARYRETLD
jgi:ABC-2 type transport system permease protein